MKISLLILTILLTSNLFAAETMNLSFADSVKLEQTIVKKDLPVNFIKLYRAVNEEKRMIAGDFERSTKKTEKKTYLDGLRSKLQGSKGLIRF